MARLVLSSLAEQDLADILEYIARDNPHAGVEFVDRIEDKCFFLAENPFAGKLRLDLGECVRTFPIQSYLIIYRPISDGAEVIRVVSGYRDIGALFA